jgi:23S rRNA pseudouridine2605 synthase
MRLQRFLAECGIASRREAETFIIDGQVFVNGTVATLGDRVDVDNDEIHLNGKQVSRNKKIYLVLHKPRGVITSAKDTSNRRTVIDCLEGLRTRVYPVGRLDMDVSGTLILTNDGELAFRLTHPKFEVDKLYFAKVEGIVEETAIGRLEAGVRLKDGPVHPAKVTIRKVLENSTLITLSIHEGRKHLVKRMCAAVGHPVQSLKRIAVASVRVDGLAPGEWRYLYDSELEGLRKVTGLMK